MKHICISHLISQQIPSYGNRDNFYIISNSSIKNGETTNSSSWFFSNNHIGTHIDVPHHFCINGKKTFEYSIEDFFFNKIGIIDIPCNIAKLISIEDFSFANRLFEKNIELLLIRTGFEKFRKEEKYWNDNPGLSAELSDFFRVFFPELRCVGFDFISLTSWKFREEGKKSHRAFLCPENGAREILVIEDMSLFKINGTIKQVVVAPLFIEDGNGGAVTIFADIN